ncbi:MAG: hypothetical protein IAE99_04885 [Rhodothermales bacterium]|nr:hypothetical protein [Rhodothermales bacterium]
MRKGLLALMLGASLVGCDEGRGCIGVRGVVVDSLTMEPLKDINMSLVAGWGINVDVDYTDIEGRFDLEYCNESNLFLTTNATFIGSLPNSGYKTLSELIRRSGRYERRILLPRK